MSRAARWLGPAAVAAFAAGTAWRWVHVTQLHDPRRYVYSDMAAYLAIAERLATPGYVPSAGDALWPAGAPTLFAWFYRHDPGLQWLVWFQFLVAALVPLAVGMLAGVAFGGRSARVAVIVSSLYFPFVDYGGYFLTEIYLTLCVPLTMALLLWASRLDSTPRVIGAAGAAGVVASGALALKVLALPALAAFWLIHGVFSGGAARRVRALALGALLLGALPGGVALGRWCTRANDGHFCLNSNITAANFLLGHYGRIQGIVWRDPSGRTTFRFGSPSAYQRYRAMVEVPFAIMDGDANRRAAWAWIREQPGAALVLSTQHVYDLFLGALPWPTSATDDWVGAEGAHYLFVAFLLLPTLGLCLATMRRRGLRGLLGSTEMAVLSPVLGVMAAAFVSVGEPRFRIPFDGLFIVLAIEFYRGLAPGGGRASAAVTADARRVVP